ncbi:glycoside hydrolase family 5 protein [Prosthecobacter sp.]|uniref:glycoside hydrolase family 5 protein n=1 Tax=Prosthecobacter sp. TaxID=1965333 RepID=UPI00378467DB
MIRKLAFNFLATPLLAFAASGGLLPNGDFEAGNDAGFPASWPANEHITWQQEGGNHFLRLQSPKPGANVTAFRFVTLSPDVKALELSYKVRYDGIKRGRKAWFDGRIILNFKGPSKEAVSPSPKPPTFTGTAKDWKSRTQQFRVPDGAATLELLFTLFEAESGQLDFDDIALTPIPVSIIDAADAAAAEKEAARIAALPKPKPQVPVALPEQLPPPLHVAGNQLQTPAGKSVWLQGLALPSMEWSAGGENILKSIETGLTEWKASCIRLCLREHFYAGKGPYQNDGGMRYRQLVEDAVNACAAKGAYIVLDLHDYRAPREKHAEFWQEVAKKYKNHPAVIFELLNEPHDIPWKVWRDGGPVTDQKKSADVATENKQALVSFQSIGMQRLVDVIRETGAQNLIIAGGLDWGYDLGGILDGFALDDHGGHGIMYSSHVYPWKSDWQGKFLDAAAKYPIFIGEVGADTQPMDFLPPERQENPATWVPDMLGVIQQHHLHWTAWCFHPKATPRVLLDWDYTPTPFWGVFVKQALAGTHFESKRMR